MIPHRRANRGGDGRGWRDRLRFLAGAALLLSGIATLLALLGDRWWGFELLTHFKVQLAATQIAGLLYFGARRRVWHALLILPVLLINVAAVAPYYLPARAEAADPAEGARRLRVMTLNLRAGSNRIDLVERAVGEADPDVILFVEATHRWHDLLRDVRERYPHGAYHNVRRRSAILLASRIPLHDARIVEVGRFARPIAVASVCPDGDANACLTLVGGHPPRPQNAHTSAVRDDQLLGMAAVARPIDGPVVMLGDFNATPYSPVFSKVLAVGQLRDSALGFAPKTTWLTRFPLFGLPIDHILVSRGIAVTDRRVGRFVGSDHYPVVVDLAF